MKKKQISFDLPLEVRIKFVSLGSDKKNKKTIKELTKWLSDDLKNIYLPIGNFEEVSEPPTATITKIKIGKIK